MNQYEELKRRLMDLTFAWNAIPPREIKETIAEVDALEPVVDEVCAACGDKRGEHFNLCCVNKSDSTFTPRQPTVISTADEYLDRCAEAREKR